MVKRAYAILRPVLRSVMTEDVLKTAKVDIDGTLYLDDFLGDNDVNLFNKTKVRYFLFLMLREILLDQTVDCSVLSQLPTKTLSKVSGKITRANHQKRPSY